MAQDSEQALVGTAQGMAMGIMDMDTIIISTAGKSIQFLL